MLTSCQIILGSFSPSFCISCASTLRLVTLFPITKDSDRAMLFRGEFCRLVEVLLGVAQLLFICEVDGRDWLSKSETLQSKTWSDDQSFSLPKIKDFQLLLVRPLVLGSVLALLLSTFSKLLHWVGSGFVLPLCRVVLETLLFFGCFTFESCDSPNLSVNCRILDIIDLFDFASAGGDWTLISSFSDITLMSLSLCSEYLYFLLTMLYLGLLLTGSSSVVALMLILKFSTCTWFLCSGHFKMLFFSSKTFTKCSEFLLFRLIVSWERTHSSSLFSPAATR